MDRFEELAEVADAWGPSHPPGRPTRTDCLWPTGAGRPLMEGLCQITMLVCGCFGRVSARVLPEPGSPEVEFCSSTSTILFKSCISVLLV